MLVSSLFLAAASLAHVQHVQAQKVFAHFMGVNTYSYTQDDWAKDISDASNVGIDGFAINLNSGSDYEVEKIGDAYAAAAAHGNFQLFFSFDLHYNWDVQTITSLVATYAPNPVSYRWKDEAILISTYSGENSGNDFWAQVKSTLSAQGINTVFAPAFSSWTDPGAASSNVANYPSLDGFFNWQAWPFDNGDQVTTDLDLAYQSAVKDRGGPYIMSVSPWQFKEIGDQSNWVEFSDTLWNYRWQQAIDQVKPDIVEIVTWNDYAESHYIGDINKNVALFELVPQYVYGHPHTAWQIMASYYIQWYKTGSAPSISTETVVFWYRLHPKAVQCGQGGKPRNTDYPADAVFAVSLLASPAKVSLDIGSSHYEWDAPAGTSVGSVPFPVEDAQIPYVQILRDGAKVKDGYGSMPVNQTCPGAYDFNPWVGSI